MTAKIIEYPRKNISKLKVIMLTLDAVGPYTDDLMHVGYGSKQQHQDEY